MPRVPSSSLVDTRNKSHRESYRSAMSTAASTDNSTFLFERLRIETQLRHPPESKQSMSKVVSLLSWKCVFKCRMDNFFVLFIRVKNIQIL